MPSSATKATSHIRNSLWNLLGQVLPLIVGVFTIPILIREMGKDRFGLLSIAWMLIGYLSLFDLGLGRALTKLIAELDVLDKKEQVGELAWTGLGLMFLSSIAGTLALMALLPGIMVWLKIPQELTKEVHLAFLWLGIGLPLTVITSGLRSLLEARLRFVASNFLRILLGLWIFLGPLAVIPFTSKLDWVILSVVIGRFLVMLVSYAMCRLSFPEMGHFQWNGKLVRGLITFGGWLTLAALLGPVMTYMDRLLVGGALGVSVIAFYVTPFEITSKLVVAPMAITGALFPVLSKVLAIKGDGAANLMEKAYGWDFLLSWPVMLLLMMFARELMGLWLGLEFAAHSALILQWLAAGSFIYIKSFYPIMTLHATGRPDLHAKLYFVELLVYLPLLWFLLHRHGIVGVAEAWTIRTGLDTLAMTFLSGWVLPSVRKALVHGSALMLAGVFLGWACCQPSSLLARICLFIACMVGTLVWLYLKKHLLWGETSPACVVGGGE
jgi:O-antigen/teichoic acid export membrane protein